MFVGKYPSNRPVAANEQYLEWVARAIELNRSAEPAVKSELPDLLTQPAKQDVVSTPDSNEISPY